MVTHPDGMGADPEDSAARKTRGQENPQMARKYSKNAQGTPISPVARRGIAQLPFPTRKCDHPCGQTRATFTQPGSDWPGPLTMTPRNAYPPQKGPGVRQKCPRSSKPGVPDGRQRPDFGSRSCVSPPSCYSLGHFSEGYAVAETGIRRL